MNIDMRAIRIARAHSELVCGHHTYTSQFTWTSHIYITLHTQLSYVYVYVRSTLGISLDALNLRLYTAIARVVLFIVSGKSVPIPTGVQAAPRCDRTSATGKRLCRRAAQQVEEAAVAGHNLRSGQTTSMFGVLQETRGCWSGQG